MILFLCSKPSNSSFSYPELKSNSFKCSKDLTCFVLSPFIRSQILLISPAFSSLQLHTPLPRMFFLVNVGYSLSSFVSSNIIFFSVIPTQINLFKTESHPHPKIPILLYTPSPVHSTLISHCIIC